MRSACRLGEVKLRTTYWPKPIASAGADWEAVARDWDIGVPVGHGPTERDAIEDSFHALVCVRPRRARLSAFSWRSCVMNSRNANPSVTSLARRA